MKILFKALSLSLMAALLLEISHARTMTTFEQDEWDDYDVPGPSWVNQSRPYTDSRRDYPESNRSRGTNPYDARESSGRNAPSTTPQLDSSLTPPLARMIQSSVRPSATQLLEDAVRSNPRQAVFGRMLAKSRRMRVEASPRSCPFRISSDAGPDGKRKVDGIMAYTTINGNVIYICDLLSNINHRTGQITQTDLTLTYLHEIAHTAGIVDECEATRLAREVLDVGGLSSQLNPYEARCGRSESPRPRRR